MAEDQGRLPLPVDRLLAQPAGPRAGEGFDSGLGRLSIVCGANIYDRPFLAPLHKYAAAVRTKLGKRVGLTKLPSFVRFTLFHLKRRLAERNTIHCDMGQAKAGSTVERFRSDAKAEGDIVTIGGYQAHDVCGKEIPHGDAKCLFLKLVRKSAAWPSTKENHSERLLRWSCWALASMMLLLDGDGLPELRSYGSIAVRTSTDNEGNKYAIANMLTTIWPLSAFLAELAVQMERDLIILEVNWIPREVNAGADAITNGVTEWLRKQSNVSCGLSELPYLILNELLAKA